MNRLKIEDGKLLRHYSLSFTDLEEAEKHNKKYKEKLKYREDGFEEGISFTFKDICEQVVILTKEETLTLLDYLKMQEEEE
jgi:hypothetical protein